MLDRHYAPRARLVLADVTDLPSLSEQGRAAARSVARSSIDARDRGSERGENAARAARSMRRGCTALFTRLDEAGCDVIVVERVPAWRLARLCAIGWRAPPAVARPDAMSIRLVHALTKRLETPPSGSFRLADSRRSETSVG